MDFYSRLTQDQVTTAYILINFLKRLKIIGNLKLHTEEIASPDAEHIGHFDLFDFTAGGYSIIKDSYSSERVPDLELELAEIFRRY